VGLDINVFIEFKEDQNDRFKFFANVVCDRDYDFFALVSPMKRSMRGGLQQFVRKEGFLRTLQLPYLNNTRALQLTRSGLLGYPLKKS